MIHYSSFFLQKTKSIIINQNSFFYRPTKSFFFYCFFHSFLQDSNPQRPPPTSTEPTSRTMPPKSPKIQLPQTPYYSPTPPSPAMHARPPQYPYPFLQLRSPAFTPNTKQLRQKHSHPPPARIGHFKVEVKRRLWGIFLGLEKKTEWKNSK